ncbi:MAG TPA: sigma-54-dependent Fis family transcriptional regulator, partial [Candidatus Polarisedimenticolia bacterium]|nr:sigma-54-dependent Fis family transcriptional regulator [Candidatus Polarisedimenticolia bacterium]
MRATPGACGVYSTWGALLLATGRFDLGKRVIAHALHIARTADLSPLMLELDTMFSLFLCALGHYEEARSRISTAIRNHENHSPFDIRLNARLSQLQIDRALGLSLEDLDERLKPILDKARKKKMAWHTTWALILRGEALLEAGRSDEAEQALTEATKIAQKNADRPQFWKAGYWLGRVFEQRLQYERALRSYRVAALTVNELAMDIDDDRYREPFLAQPEVREVQARFERLRAEVGRKARHDIAAMSRSEKISRRMLNALNAIGQKLTSILDLDDLLTHLLDLSIENVRAERGMVFLRDESTAEMRLACARNMDKESLEEVSSFSRSVINRVAEGHTLLEVDVGKDPELSAFQSLVIHEIKSILCVPMRTRGRTVGIIYLDTRRAAQMFTDKERTFVESFASQAAIAIENARVFGDINAENARLKREAAGRGRFENLIGTSAAMMRLSDTIAGVMGSDCNVLVAGESGTGKELVAKAIHYNGPRQKRKFVAIDCGALPEGLLEAELFGFARGAFTGADRDKVGLIEESHGGTLFLDEITNTTVALQAKLLRVLQEHEVRRLGENSPRRVDARIIAATNANIASLIRDGKFRSDLFYRLNVVTIEVPPLRDRREDIPLLVEHFVRQLSPDETSRRRLAPGVVEALGRYDWPGNVRELENVVERLLVLARGPIISQDALPENIRAAAGLRDLAAVARSAALDGGNNGRKTGEQMLVEDALRRFRGDKAKAARFIGWNRQKLYRKMKGFGIPADYGRTV